MRIVVVLPAPFGPRKPVTCPGRTVKLRSSTAVTAPNRLVSRCSSIMAAGPGRAGLTVPGRPGRRTGRRCRLRASGPGRSAPTPTWAGSAPDWRERYRPDSSHRSRSRALPEQERPAARIRDACAQHGDDAGHDHGVDAEPDGHADGRVVRPGPRRAGPPAGVPTRRAPASAGRLSCLVAREMPAQKASARSPRSHDGRMLSSSRIAGSSAVHSRSRSARSSAGSRRHAAADQPLGDPLHRPGPAHRALPGIPCAGRAATCRDGPRAAGAWASSRRATRAPSAVSR